MIEPGSGTGTLFASADGEAIGGSAGGPEPALSLLISSLSGFGFGSLGAFLFSALLTDGEGVGVGSTFSTDDTGASDCLPFSSSSALPTSFEVVRPTSFSAAHTDAPREVISVPPSPIHSFRDETPP